MKRFTFAACVLLLIAVLCSCNYYGHQIEPVKTEVQDFDLEEAQRMLESSAAEKLIADISVKESVSRQEFDAFISVLQNEYGDNYYPWAAMFFDNREFEDESVNVLYLNDNMFYPTLYHEDIELTSAKITDYFYEDNSLNMSILTIRIEYTGDDANLKEWYRESNYKKIDNTWVFDHFTGPQQNFLGDEFKPDYLKLK
jgi:hypothetical protein